MAGSCSNGCVQQSRRSRVGRRRDRPVLPITDGRFCRPADLPFRVCVKRCINHRPIVPFARVPYRPGEVLDSSLGRRLARVNPDDVYASRELSVEPQASSVLSAARQQLARLLLPCAFAVLAGCASMGPPLSSATPEEVASQDVTLGVRTFARDGRFEVLSSSVVARRLEARLGDEPVSILALSGGGATGAFGAGALAGLARSGTRPEFSVVTGVSAGALVAPFAFLGPASDAEMTAIYTDGVTRGLLQRRLLGAVFGSSVYSGVPLRRLIDHYADDGMIAAVAAEAARGRLLLVATTDFATGEPVVWDLGSVALNGGSDAKRLFRTILLASASVPGMFPPVHIRVPAEAGVREETHVDGGVTVPFFIAPALQDLPAAGGGGQPALVRVVIDGRLRDFPHAANANALSIFSRSISAGLNRMTRTALEGTVETSRQRGIALEYAAIPASYPLHGAFNFSPDEQRALFQYAASCAEAGRLWIRAPHPQSTALPTSEHRAASGDAPCPADDRFIGRFVALDR
jgi:patatin-like phospholipase